MVDRAVQVRALKGIEGEPDQVWHRLRDNGDGTYSIAVTDKGCAERLDYVAALLEELVKIASDRKAVGVGGDDGF